MIRKTLLLTVVLLSALSMAQSGDYLVMPESPGYDEPFAISVAVKAPRIHWLAYKADQTHVVLPDSALPEGTTRSGKIYSSPLKPDGSTSYGIFKGFGESSEISFIAFKVAELDAEIVPIGYYQAEGNRYNSSYSVNGYSRRVSQQQFIFYKANPLTSNIKLGFNHSNSVNSAKPTAVLISLADYQGNPMNLTKLKRKDWELSSSKTVATVPLSEEKETVAVKKDEETPVSRISCHLANLGMLVRLPSRPGLLAYKIRYSDESHSVSQTIFLGEMEYDQEQINLENERLTNIIQGNDE